MGSRIRLLPILCAVLVTPLVPTAGPLDPTDQPLATHRSAGAALRAEGGHHGHLQPDAYTDHWNEAQRSRRYTNHGLIGEVRPWAAAWYDWEHAFFYLKEFELRAVGAHIEVWTPVGDEISRGLQYPEGDCRNEGEFTTLTDDQIALVVDAFENNIYPTSSALFGKPANRNGRDFALKEFEPWMPSNMYQGPGQRIVVLIDNFRSPSFFGHEGPGGPAGFVSPLQMELVDRNVLNMRGVGWAWQLGEAPTPPSTAGQCYSPPIWPSFIEQVTAHEYAHVLQSGVNRPDDHRGMLGRDPKWVTEGLAVWSERIHGYGNSSSSDPAQNFDTLCVLGQLSLLAPDDPFHCLGGPENSLFLWDESHQPQTDYGIAGAFFEYVEGRFGKHHVTAFHCSAECGYGSAKADMVLRAAGAPSFYDVVSDLQAALAMDALIDGGAVVGGAGTERFRSSELDASIEWDSPFASQAPGVAFGAADFVRLRDASGHPLTSQTLDVIRFVGNTHSQSAWVIAPHGHGFRNPSLFSGPPGNKEDRMIAREVSVPIEHPLLSFDIRYDLEAGYDYAFVQWSDDGGASWVSLAGTSTSASPEPDADPSIAAMLPGFTGHSEGWRRESLDLSPWAGKQGLLGFRLRTDTFIPSPGAWIDNVVLGTRLVSDGSTLDGWRQLVPTFRLPVRLVSYTSDGAHGAIHDLLLDAGNDATLSRNDLNGMIVPDASVVAVIVGYLPERQTLPIRYQLWANEVLQAGG